MAEFVELLELVKRGDMDSLGQALAENPRASRLADEKGVSLLLHALYSRQAGAVELLRRRTGELNLYEAAALGDSSRLQALLAADPSLVNSCAGDGFTPLQLACYFRRPEATRLLLDSGADTEAVSQNGMALRAIHAAASSGDLESIQLLLAHGADANSTQHGGYTALHAAAANGSRELVELLLEHGVDASLRNHQDQMAADMAEARGHGELAESLQRQ